MRIEIIVPDSLMPKKDPVNPCPCQFREFKLQEKKGQLFWLVQTGESVKRGQVIAEGEVEKKTLEFVAPCDGIVESKIVEDEGSFFRGDIIGYIASSN